LEYAGSKPGMGQNRPGTKLGGIWKQVLKWKSWADILVGRFSRGQRSERLQWRRLMTHVLCLASSQLHLTSRPDPSPVPQGLLKLVHSSFFSLFVSQFESAIDQVDDRFGSTIVEIADMLNDPVYPQGRGFCLICGVSLSHLQRAQGDRVCGERCRWKYATLPPHQICVACGRPLSPREFGDRVCTSLECRQQVKEQKQELERHRLERLQERARELRDREGRLLRLEEPETYKPTVLPSSRARIADLPEDRRHAFHDFLARLIGDAVRPTTLPVPSEAGPTPASVSPVAPSPEVQAVLNGACALCQGFCCGNGGNRAYLTVKTIRRYMAQHPDQGPHDVLSTYLGRIRKDAVPGSCIFHQPGGCGLPREMRSDTCNRFFCQGLMEFQQGLTGQDHARVFLVATEGEAILAAAFYDADGLRLVPLHPGD